MVTARAKADPAALLGSALIAPKVRHRAAITDPAKVGQLLRDIDAYQGAPITRLALQIAAHVMVRPGELRKATWNEFDFEAKIWRVTEGRMKMRRAQAVPLSDQVIDFLRELQQFSEPEGFAFPAFHTSRRPMSENTKNVALRRMGYGKDEMTSHGFRTTASTLLNESGKWHPDAIERALAHGDSDAVRGICNRGQYWEERKAMMQWWSDLLDRLTDFIDHVNGYLFNVPKSKDTDPLTRYKLNPTPSDRALFHDLLDMEYAEAVKTYRHLFWGATVPKNTPFPAFRAYFLFNQWIEEFALNGPIEEDPPEDEFHESDTDEKDEGVIGERLEGLLNAVLVGGGLRPMTSSGVKPRTL